MKVYIKKEKIGVDAVGEYNTRTGELLVLKGSKVSNDIANSEKFRGATAIAEHRKDTVKNNKTICAVSFKSPSTAGNFVTGRSTNGYVAWCDETGKKLKEVLGR